MLIKKELADFLCHQSVPLPCEALSVPRRMSRAGASKYPVACMSSSAVVLECLRSLGETGAVTLEEVPVDGKVVLKLTAVHAERLSSAVASDEQMAPPLTTTSNGTAGDDGGMQRAFDERPAAATAPPSAFSPGPISASPARWTPMAAAAAASSASRVLSQTMQSRGEDRC